MNDSLTLSSSGTVSLGTTTGYNTSNTWNSGTTYITNPQATLHINTNINMNELKQNQVLVFKVTRNDENEIISTEFLKEMWVETKNGQSVDFAVARDKDLAGYKAEDLAIKTLFSVTF